MKACIRWLAACLFCVFLPSAALAQAVHIEPAGELADLLQKHLGLDEQSFQDEVSQDAALRSLRKRVPDLLATEGYFSPRVDAEMRDGALLIKLDAGPRTLVSELDIQLDSAGLSPETRATLLASWHLPVGAAFRQAAWDEAKQGLLGKLLSQDFPDASLDESRADIDPASQSARLSLNYRSGPRVVYGDLRFDGLSRYSVELATRFNRSVAPGKPYREDDFFALQKALQQTAYFNSVLVELLPAEQESIDGVEIRPVLVRVGEKKPHRFTTGAGYSSNTGARIEASISTADLFWRGWELQTGLRVEQLRQTAYADLFLPPNKDGSADSFGVVGEHSDIQHLLTDKSALGLVRTRQVGRRENRNSLSWTTELQSSDGQPDSDNQALAVNTMWTWRLVDSLVYPRSGVVVMGELGGGVAISEVGQNFVRPHTKMQWFMPLGKADVFSLRGELGATIATSRIGIPTDWLFRTGGSQTVRGYDYLSLGVKEGSVVYGARYLAVGSAEYTHWFDDSWGGAGFVDAGDARDSMKGFKPALGIGFGPRLRSPVGPIGLDIAYGVRTRAFKAHFSLAIPF